jgi:hypothetical protein
MKFFLTTSLLILSTVVASTFKIDRSNVITLYNDKDKVVELDDNNLTSTIYSSQQVPVIYKNFFSSSLNK